MQKVGEIKKLIYLFVMVILVSGCATISDYDIQRKRIAEDFWNNKISASTYKELLNGINKEEARNQVYSALCEQCERVFSFNKLQWDSNTEIPCPYCGHTQDLKMAYNRYVYLRQQQEQEKQKQQAVSNQIAVSNFFQSYQQNLKQSAQRQQQYLQQYNENVVNTLSNWGSLKSAPSYQYVPPRPSSNSYHQSDWWQDQGGGWHGSDNKGGSTNCWQDQGGGFHCSGN